MREAIDRASLAGNEGRANRTCVFYNASTFGSGTWVYGFLACLAFCSISCAQTIRHLAPTVAKPPNAVVFFLVDGLDYTRLSQMLEAGDLPNIKRQFLDNGVQVTHAVSSLPSITYPNCTSFITGVFPGHHGITGNYWFDRYALIARYYMTLDSYLTVNEHFSVPTLYDVLHDQFTLNIQDHTRRGVTTTIDNKNWFTWDWMRGRYGRADYHVGDSIAEAIDIANKVGKWPRVLTTYYPGVDEIGHRHGSDSAEYAEALRNVDLVIGRILREVEGSGAGPSIYYCLATDHSHSPVKCDQHLDMLKWLVAGRGLSVWGAPLGDDREYVDRVRKLSRYDAVATVDAGRVVMVHLPGATGWSSRLSTAELTEWVTRRPSLLEVPAVEMVMMRAGNNRVKLMNRAGSAILERRLEERVKQYRVTDQQGGIRLDDGRAELIAFTQQGWHTSREWLEMTSDQQYPDIVPQAVEMFDSSHTGDVVIMAASGWGFAFGPAENGGHGTCLSCDMHVPMMFSGPDLPRGTRIRNARLVDVMPTALGLLGEEKRLDLMPAIDGVNLADQLRQAK